MPNRFNQVFEKEQYVPMVQPLPYEALASLGDSIQKENDALTEASMNLQSLMSKIKVDPYDIPFKKQFDSEYTPLFTKLADKISKGDPTSRKDLIELRNKFGSDERLNIFAHNYEVGKSAREDYQKLQNEGKTSSYGWSNQFDNSAKSRKQLEPFNYQGHSAWFDPYKDASLIMSGINDTQLRSGLKNFAVGPNGKLVLVGNTGVTGVNKNKLEQVANASLESFINSNGGRSYIRDLQAQGITDEKELLKKSYEYLIDVSTKQLGVKGGDPILDSVGDHYNEDKVVNPLGIGDGQKIGLGLNQSYLQNLNLPTLDNFKYTQNPIGGSVGPLGQPSLLNFSDNTKAEKYKPTNFVEKRILERGNNALGRTSNGGAESIKTMNDWIKSFFDNLNYNIYNLNTSSKDVNELNNLLFDKGQIKFSGNIISRDEPNKPIPASQFIKENQDKEPVSSTTLGLINPYGIPYAPVITTKDGGEYYINNPLKQISESDKIIADWGRAYFSPGPVEIKMPGSNKKYYMEFIRETNKDLTNQGNVGIGTNGRAVLYNSDGEIISSSSEDLQQSPESAFIELYTKIKK